MNSFKTYLWAILCLLLPFCSKAQSYEVGAYIGGSNYQGDLADGILILSETQTAYGGIMRITPFNFISFSIGFIQAGIKGDDANSSNEEIRKRGFSINTKMRELSFKTELQLPSYGNLSSHGIFKPSITPFIFGGIGFASRDNDPQAPPLRYPNPFPEYNSKKSFISIPFGAGIKFHFTETLATSLEWGMRATFSDYVDGVSNMGNPLKRDYYMVGGLSLTYVFNGGGDNPFLRMKR